MRRISIVVLFVIMLCVFCACEKESVSTRDNTRDNRSEVEADSVDYKELKDQLQKSKEAEKKQADEKEALENELAKVKEELKQSQNELIIAQNNYQAAQQLYETEKNRFAEYKEEMAEYVALSEEEKEAREAEARMTIEKEKEEKERKEKEAAEARKKEEEEKKKAEEKAKKEAEEKEKKGYETGIKYDQLARTPDKYKGEKVKFTGEVVQVLEGNDYNEIRLSVHKTSSGWYDSDQIIYCAYKPNIIDYRLLEGDIITIYGISQGIISYESIWGQTITLPFVMIDKLEQKK